MSTEKIIKDPVHGYITVEEMFVPLLNSPEFQRLRNIEQGSFRVLFPSARHDRFIHSLGVYHLACLVSKKFEANLRDDLPEFLESVENIDKILKETSLAFRYASLMHDVGHAPFSHTTEDFFKELKKSDISKTNVIEDDLIEVCKSDKSFSKDFKNASPKPHEILSATLAVELGERKLLDINYPLVARMITGCLYSRKDKESCIKNCFITLLNSSAVDVDKLDYIKRDTFMSGFSNVVVDTDRMINSLTAVLVKKELVPAFRKNAISVIDNIFRAKNEQSNWVISHPSVQYEMAMIEFSVRDLYNETAIREKVFSKKSLSLEGNDVNGDLYRLMNDSDFIDRFSKNMNPEKPNIFNEFFDRSCRRKPMWKSYYEYKFYFGDKSEQVYDFFSPLVTAMSDLKLSEKTFSIDESTVEKLSENEGEVLNAYKFLKEFAESYKSEIEFSFVLIDVENKFSAEMEPENIYIMFSNKKAKPTYRTYAELLGGTKAESSESAESNENDSKNFSIFI